MDGGRRGILGHQAPSLAGPWGAPRSRERAMPAVPGPSAGGPLLGAGDVSHPQPWSTETSPPTHPRPKAGKKRSLGSGAEATSRSRPGWTALDEVPRGHPGGVGKAKPW